MKRSNSTISLALVGLLASSSLQLHAEPQPSWYSEQWTKVSTSVKNYFTKIDKTTATTVMAIGAGCAAFAGLIWWLAFDHRSDEQVITDVRRLIDSNNRKYEPMIQLLANAHLSSYTIVDEQLLQKFVEAGVDTYYLYYVNQTIKKMNKEAETLSKRIDRSKVDDVCKRMKLVRNDLMQTIETIRPLQQFLEYHASYMQLYRTVTELQRTYTEPCRYKTSQKKLLQHVVSQGSAFASYPYFDYVEKIERAAQRLKSAMHEATYAKSSHLYGTAQELHDNILVVKGTVASTSEYREDVQKRERARVKMQQEQARAARELAAQLRDLEAQRERERIHNEREKLAREQRDLELRKQQQANADRQRYEQERQRQELERAQQAQAAAYEKQQQQAQWAVYQQQLQYEQQQRDLQQQQADAWRRQQEWYQQTGYPSAPPVDEQEQSVYQAPEPSAPGFDE